MKLDISISKWLGFFRAAGQTAILLAGVAGMTPRAMADDFAGLADPTLPAFGEVAAAASMAAKPSGPVLQSTFISASQRRAVISGRSYAVGDKFGGGVITDIQPYEVVLKKADRESRLRLLPKLAKESYMVKVPVSSR